MAGRRAYHDAVAQLSVERGRGIAALEAFLAKEGNSLYADDAALRLAVLAREDGRDGEAKRRLEWSLVHHPRGDKSDLIRLELASLELAAGRGDEAQRVAEPIRLSLLDADHRKQAHLLKAEIAKANGDGIEELRWLGRVRADQIEPAERVAVEERIDALLAPMDGEALEATAQKLGRRMPASRVWLLRAERAISAGQRPAATAALRRASALPLTKPEGQRLADLRARLKPGGDRASTAPSWETVGEGPSTLNVPEAEATLGVVLPLSGPYASFGEETLEGVLLAAGLFDGTRNQPSTVRVVVRDSGGNAARAAAAVEELAADPEVIAIVGPLTAPAAEAAAPVAEDYGVPLLTLTSREEVAELGRYVLRIGATPRHEAERLADYAVQDLGLRRFAILYPDDDYGQELRSVFWEAVEARGAEVVGVARYPLDATDFAQSIRRLIGFDFLSGAQSGALQERARLLKRAKRLPAEKAKAMRAKARTMTASGGAPLPPFVDFDALFIPDAHENVGLIAPHLAFHEVHGVRLLGTAGWSHPDLVQLGGKHVNGAVFATPFYAQSEVPFVAEFSRRFQENFGSEPSYLAAHSFDAAHLVLLQVARGAGGRDAILTGLLKARRVIGASGVISIGESGSAEKRPHLLGVDRGTIVSVDETGVAPYLRIRGPRSPADGDPAT